jgi:hypothetical protein
MFPDLTSKSKGVSASLATIVAGTGYCPATDTGVNVGFAANAVPPETGYTPYSASNMTLKQALNHPQQIGIKTVRHVPGLGFVKPLGDAPMVLTQTIPKGCVIHLNKNRNTAAHLAGKLISSGLTPGTRDFMREMSLTKSAGAAAIELGRSGKH